MTRLPALMALLTACATLACGARVSTPTTLRPASAQGIVYVSTGARIDIVEVPGGQVLGEMPLGTPSPDWRWIYTAGHGRLEQVDTATGRLAASLPAPDWAQSVRTSANGAWLALIGSSTGPPSRFEVMDAAFARQPVLVGLNGVFTFDGLSNDGRRLYLLQWVRAGSYQVRMYDLVAGILNPQVIADKREIGQLMSGEALTSLTTTDGASQLTLYQRSAKNEAFVHELPIGVVQDVPFAYCQDLPSPASGWAFVQRPQRGLFYAANPQAGWVIELSSQFVRGPFSGSSPRQARLSLSAGSPPDGQPAAAVSPDGTRLVMSTWPGLAAVDTASLSVSGRSLQGERIKSVGYGPDGSTLYALSQAGNLLLIDARTMTKVSEIALASPGEAILHIS